MGNIHQVQLTTGHRVNARLISIFSGLILVICLFISSLAYAGGYSLRIDNAKIHKVDWQDQNATLVVSGIAQFVVRRVGKSKSGSTIQIVNIPLKNVPVKQTGKGYGKVPAKHWPDYRKKISAYPGQVKRIQAWGVSFTVKNSEVISIECAQISLLRHLYRLKK